MVLKNILVSKSGDKGVSLGERTQAEINGLRIEDTNEDRSMKEYADYICKDLDWMELRWEEGPKVGGPHEPYFQSERNKIYELYYQKLTEADLIYPCFTTEEELKIIRRNQLAAGEPPRYPGIWSKASKEEIKNELDKGSKPVYRFRMLKNKTISFIDLVKGEQNFDSNDLDDFIVRKEDGSPTFMYANAIDDAYYDHEPSINYYEEEEPYNKN